MQRYIRTVFVFVCVFAVEIQDILFSVAELYSNSDSSIVAVEFLPFPVLFLLSACRRSSCCVTRPPAAITQSLRYSEEL